MAKKFLPPFKDFEPGQYTYEIQRRLGKPYAFTHEQCDLQYGTWQKCNVVYLPSGQTIYSDFFCIPFHLRGYKAYITVSATGICSFREVKIKSRSEMWSDIYSFYKDSLLMILGISNPEKLKPFLSLFEKLPDILKTTTENILNYIKDGIEFFQKQAARIDEAIHIDEVKILHDISLALSPEYRDYWLKQESKLCSLSNKIFGDFQTVSSYVHLAEIFYYIQIKNAKRTENEKRLHTLQHGAQVTALISRDIQKYQRNPMRLWSDIYYYTFDEGNKYIDREGVSDVSGLVEALNEIGEAFKVMNSKLNDLKLFEVALAKTNLITLQKGIDEGIEAFDNLYKDTLKPTFKVIEKIYDEQQKAIAELEKREREKIEKEARAFLMSTNPEQLNDKEKIIQNNQFIKQLNNAVTGIDKRFEFKSIDIKEFTDE